MAARALTKHVHRSPGAFWGSVGGTVADKNAAARAVLGCILAEQTWWNVFGHFQHEVVYEARVPSGHGARWAEGGAEFIGFLEPFLAGERAEDRSRTSAVFLDHGLGRGTMQPSPASTQKKGREDALKMATDQGKLGTQATEALEVLERFVVENDDLLKLESRIGRFNIFDALRIARVEIRHSNFLAFLLDPAESHGQGQLFLKAILMDLFKQAPSERRPLSPIDLDGTDLRGVEVKREWKHTDLLIRCQEPPFAVVIENKIGAKEGTEQLNRYKDMVEKHYPGALYVYLTLNADEPSEDAWVPYSYEDIHRVLKRVRETHRKAIGREVLVFLDHYLNLIGTRFMNDKEIDELCQRIYKNHRQALDLIWERVGGPTSRVLSEAAAVVEEDPRWEVVARPSNCIDFVPKGWWEWLPRLALRGDPRSWIYVHLASYKGRLFIAVEMAPMTDLVKRKEIATRLLDESPAFGFTRPKTREVKNNYSRISASERILEWSEDEELEPDKIRNAVMKALDNLLPKVEKLALVLKPLCKLTASTT